MKFLDKIKGYFKPNTPSVKSEYDVYRRQRLIEGGAFGNRPYWQNHTQGITKELPVGEWRTVTSAARKLYWNVGMINSAIDQRAMLTIGRAMRPMFTGADREWGKQAETWLNDWMQIAYIDGTSWWDALFLESVAIDRDGDCLTIMTQTASGFPQLQQVPWFQIGMRDSDGIVKQGKYKGLRIENGVILSATNRAIAYRVLGAMPEDDRDIPSQSCMLTKDPREIGQVRGITSLAAAVMDLRALATLGDDIRTASQMAAKIGLLVTNQTGVADVSDPAYMLNNEASINMQTGIRMEQMQGGTIQYLAPGEEVTQIKAEIPTEAQDRLQERLIRQSLLALGWPPEFGWDMSKLAGASARIVLEQVNRVTADRHQYLSQFCKKRCAFAISKAVELGILPPYKGEDKDRGGAYQFKFTAPPKLTADASYASSDAINAYRAGMRSMTEILGEGGITLEEHLDQVESEELEIRRRMERSSLPRSVFGILTPNGQPPDMIPSTVTP
jgi:capsid protein